MENNNEISVKQQNEQIDLEKNKIEFQIKQIELQRVIDNKKQSFIDKYQDLIKIAFAFLLTTIAGGFFNFILDQSKTTTTDYVNDIKEKKEVFSDINKAVSERVVNSYRVYSAIDGKLPKDSINIRWEEYRLAVIAFDKASEINRAKIEIMFGKDSNKKFYEPVVHALLLSHQQIYYLKRKHLKDLPKTEFFRTEYIKIPTKEDKERFIKSTEKSKFEVKMEYYRVNRIFTDSLLSSLNDMMLIKINEVTTNRTKNWVLLNEFVFIAIKISIFVAATLILYLIYIRIKQSK